MPIFVRPFQPEDREALLQIGAETAFFGAPIEKFLEDRHVFMDAFYSYYTDYEPEHAWVACVDNKVAGFLTGCFNSTSHDRVMQRKLLPRVIWKWLRGGYHPGPKTWQYTRAAFGAALRGEIPGADITRYPAHLHINLLPEARGYGLGRQLIEAYLGQLLDACVPGVHLQTTSMNVVACKLYEKVGFRLLAAKPTRMYAHLVDGPVEARCYGMELTRS